MPRADANTIALRFLRNLLDAPVPPKISVAGRDVDLVATRGVPPKWPHVLALDEASAGPWPVPLHVSCSWSGGRTKLELQASFYGPGNSRYAYHVGLQVRVDAQSTRDLVWIGLPALIGDVPDGTALAITNAAVVNRATRLDPTVSDAARAQLRHLVDLAGLPRDGAAVTLCDIGVPDGIIAPLPAMAITNVIKLALLKQIFVTRDGRGRAEGTPLFEPELQQEVAAASKSGDEPLANSIGVLPGPTDKQKETLDVILDWVEGKTLTAVEELRAEIQRRFSVGEATAIDVGRFLAAVGFLEIIDRQVALSPDAIAYLRSKTPEAVFEMLRRHSRGVLELLVIVGELGPVDVRTESKKLAAILETGWTSDAQTNRRRYWLLSLGLIRTGDNRNDTITEAGRALLHRHPEEVAEIRDDLSNQLAAPGRTPAKRVDIRPEAVRENLGSLMLPDEVIEQACAALSSGSHLLLVGPPGTGKTQFARALAETARKLSLCSGLLGATASADWTTFETIGGYALEPAANGASRLAFRAGLFPRAIHEEKWLLIDELNRADADKAFGELMTVLAGGGSTLPFRDEDGGEISIGPSTDESHPGGWTYSVAPTFRVIATMNTMDKGSLYQLSYALQRRFAMVDVGVPPDSTMGALIRRAASADLEGAPPLAPEIVDRLVPLFSSAGLSLQRAVGPSIALDMIRYVRRRGGKGDAVAEAIPMYLLPQLAGLDRKAAGLVEIRLVDALQDLATPAGTQTLRRRIRELFPEMDGPA